MAFEPLGYRFELSTLLSAEAVKAAIRMEKKGWFAAEGLPRGWIVGPFLCLWQSAFDRYGPMLLARIDSEGLHTRIVGRAGADINGTALFLVLAPLMAWITWKMHEAGQGDTKTYVIIGLVFGLGLPLTLWVNSKDRKDAAPLVTFISEVIASTSKSSS